MNIPDNIIPANISTFIAERNQIRNTWRESQGEAGQLNAQNNLISPQASPEPVAPLTQSKTPPAELKAVLPLLGSTLMQRDQLSAQIAEQQTAIQKIRDTERLILVSLILAGILILVLCVVLLAHAIHLF